ncbi:ubiquitin-conjugating enzyme/RWD-like protein [Boletus edulis]|nr:ubiquitin-conjugating enzyme/RWD-like protein [Boletus edulis]
MTGIDVKVPAFTGISLLVVTTMGDEIEIHGSSRYKLSPSKLKWIFETLVEHPDSPYKGGTFRFKLELPTNFPFKAPNVVFQTKVYHPGINEEGSICVSILRDEVSPWISFDLNILLSVLAIVQEKLNNPSPDDPYDPDIAALLKTDKAKFLVTAREYTKKHAM